MGLFFKKKEEKNKMDQKFQDGGFRTNDVTPKKQTRKENIKQGKEKQVLAKKTQNIEDAFLSTRKNLMLSSNDRIASYIDKYDEIYSTYKKATQKINTNQNKDAATALDNFILRVLDILDTGVLEENPIDVNSCLYELRRSVLDRASCKEFYADEKYVDCKLARFKLYVEQQRLYAQQVDYKKQMADLKELSQDPYAVASNIRDQALTIKNLAKLNEENLTKYAEKLQLLDTMVKKLEANAALITTADIDELFDQIGYVSEKSRVVDNQVDVIHKGQDQLNKSYRNVTNNDLSANSQTYEDNAKENILSDDLFEI